MSEEQLESGKKWVENTLKDYSQSLNVPLKRFTWGEGTNDFDTHQVSLVFYHQKNRKLIEAVS